VTDNPARVASADTAPIGSGRAVDTHQPDPGPWYRRRGVIVAASIALVLAITVITDLPTHSSRATDIQSANAVIKEVNSDIAPCVFAVREAFTIYGDQVRNSLTAADRSHTPALLTDDQTACSLTDESIFNLSDVEVPGSAAGKQLGKMVGSVTLWATSDALGAVDAIQTLSVHPTNASARAALARDRRNLASDRAAAEASVRSIQAMLDTNLVGLYLPQTPATSPS
jgi:hypothetical protein